MSESSLSKFTYDILKPYQYYSIEGTKENRRPVINHNGLWQIWRNNAGMVELAKGGWMHLAVAGSPDYFGLGIDGIAIGLEIKKDGKQRIKGAQETFKSFAINARYYHVFDTDSALKMRLDLIQRIKASRTTLGTDGL